MAHKTRQSISSSSLFLIALVLLGLLYLYLSPPPPSSTHSSSSSRPLTKHTQPIRPISHSSQNPIQSTPNGAFQKRVIVVGDIHGDLSHATRLLRTVGLLNLKSEWVGGEAILVQTGDIVDRGRDTIALYRLMDNLRAQAVKTGGAVVSLLGNHELMNAFGDWRYVTKEDIATVSQFFARPFSDSNAHSTSTSQFGGEAQRREALREGWIGQTWRTNYSITARVPLSQGFTSLPRSLTPPIPSYAASSPQTYVGDALPPSSEYDPFSHAAISFVHGGIIPEYLHTLTGNPIEEINRMCVPSSIPSLLLPHSFHLPKKQIDDNSGSELLHSLLSTPSTHSLPSTATPEQRFFWSEKGPMWDRSYALDEDEQEMCKRAEEACEILGVRHLVMGHTPHFEGPVERCGGKVLLIDTGISRAYGGAISATEFLYTLTPAPLDPSSPSSPEEEDVLDRGLRLRRRSKSPTTSRWLEEEVVTAWFVGDRNNEELARSERFVDLPLD
ncbi:hypothetical protein P7C70_g2160, partial [Phenoliferia sp. Uapishka_3]